MSRPITARTSAVLGSLMRGVGTDIVRARFGLTGNQLADITGRHRALLDTGDLFLLARRTESAPVALRTPAAESKGQSRSGGAHGVPPLPLVGRRLFSKHTTAEEFEYWRVDLGPRGVLVPSGALISGGDRAWRCEVSP